MYVCLSVKTCLYASTYPQLILSHMALCSYCTVACVLLRLLDSLLQRRRNLALSGAVLPCFASLLRIARRKRSSCSPSKHFHPPSGKHGQTTGHKYGKLGDKIRNIKDHQRSMLGTSGQASMSVSLQVRLIYSLHS